VRTAVQRDDALDLERVNASYVRLEDQARQSLAAEGFAPDQLDIVRSADVRYFGQAWEVRVEVPAGPFDRATANTTVDRFHAAHQATYGYSYRGSSEQRIEWVNFRVMGIGPIQRPVIQPRPRDLSGAVERAQVATRSVYFDARFMDTPIFDRRRLQPGDCIDGPAIVEEFGSTTVVFPGLHARVDDYGNLVMTKTA
jgi:N-methylhydantoinase A